MTTEQFIHLEKALNKLGLSTARGGIVGGEKETGTKMVICMTRGRGNTTVVYDFDNEEIIGAQG